MSGDPIHDQPRSPGSANPASHKPSQARTNPYVGPRALREGERIFGRDRELRELLNRLIADRLVLLYSPSGAGKSSLVQAGLIPHMRKEKFSVLPVIRVGLEPPRVIRVVTPEGDLPQPLPQLFNAGEPERFNRYILSSLMALDQELLPHNQQSLPKLAGLTFGEYLAQRPHENGKPTSRVLVFDQFEEILTQAPLDREGKLAFFDQVGEALLDHDLWALFIIREDFLAGLDPYLPLVPTYLRSTFRLDLLESQPALLAIQKPVVDQGIEFDDEAALKLVDDLRRVWVQQPDGSQREEPGLYVEPVQLQVVCRRLYRELGLDEDSNKNAISLDDVARLGDVNKALGEFYSGEVGDIAAQTEISERAIRDWFGERLITENLLRGQVLMGEQVSGGLDNNVIRMLEDSHLLRAENRRNSTWFELAHDRLVRPILEDNQDWAEKHLQEFQRRAVEWKKKDKPQALLLHSRELVNAEGWGDDHPGELNDIDRELLKASREWRARNVTTHQRKADEWEREGRPPALLLKDLELAQAEAWLAEHAGEAVPLEIDYITASREAVAQLEFKRQRRNIWIAVLSVLATGVFLLVVFFAYQSNSLARDNAALAEQQSTLAAEQRNQVMYSEATAMNIAVDRENIAATSTQLLTQVASSKGTAEALRGTSAALETQSAQDAIGRATAEYNSDLAQASRLALLAQGNIGVDQELADLLGIAAYREAPQRWEGRNALLTSLLVNPSHLVRPYGPSIPSEVASVQAIAFSADGKLLAWCGRDGKIKLWNVELGELASELQLDPAFEITTLAFSPVDNNLLVSGAGIGHLTFWNLETRAEDTQDAGYRGPNGTLIPSGELTSLAFSPDGASLAVSGENGNVTIWDVDQRQTVNYLESGGAIVRSLDWSPDGLQLAGAATNLSGGIVYIWDALTGARGDLLTSEDAIVFALDWSPDGKWLAFAGGNQFNHRASRDIVLYDTRTKNRITIPTAGRRNIRTVAFDQDSRVLAAGIQDGSLTLFNLYAGNLTTRYNPERTIGGLSHREWSPFGQILAFAPDGPNRLAYLVGGDSVNIVDIVSTRPLNVELAPQDERGSLLAAGYGPENEIRTLISEGGGIVTLSSIGSNVSIRMQGVHALSAAISSGVLVATGDETGKIRVRNIQTRAYVWEMHMSGPVSGLAFNRSGENLAVGWCQDCNTEDRADQIAVFEIGAQEPLFELDSTGMITSLAFNWDGGVLASGGPSGVIQLWDTQTQKPFGLDLLMDSRFSYEDVTALAFNQEGNMLASGNEYGEIAFWDIESRQQIGRSIRAATVPITGLLFAADGLSLVSASRDGSIQRWDLDPEQWIERLCVLNEREFTQDELLEYFSGVDDIQLCGGNFELPLGTPTPTLTPAP